jgi:hypothetical protein
MHAICARHANIHAQTRGLLVLGALDLLLKDFGQVFLKLVPLSNRRRKRSKHLLLLHRQLDKHVLVAGMVRISFNSRCRTCLELLLLARRT